MDDYKTIETYIAEHGQITGSVSWRMASSSLKRIGEAIIALWQRLLAASDERISEAYMDELEQFAITEILDFVLKSRWESE